MTHAATALRAAGFVPLPRLWVAAQDMPAIRATAAREAQRRAEIEKAWQHMKGAAE
jgi:hypothetical protein